MTASPERETVPLDPRLQQAFYQSIVLQKALNLACSQTAVKNGSSAIMEEDPLLDHEDMFQSLLNKLATICDNKRGGSTVTSCTILSTPEGPEILFCSNQRIEPDITNAKEFVQALLRLIAEQSGMLSKKGLVRRVLREVILFNLPRLGAYLTLLGHCLDACMADLDRHPLHESMSMMEESVEETLRTLKGKVTFTRDVMTSQAARDKFLSDCESLIKAVQSSRADDAFQKAMINKTQHGLMDSSLAWCELRHYLGRVLSYRHAAEALVRASEHWPALFQDPKVTWIPSSTPARKPVASSGLTAAAIVGLIEPDSEHRLSLARDMQRFGLDELIFQQTVKTTFNPSVHSEVLLHDYLLTSGLQHPSEYWHGWKRIGTSKPTCRLCQHYFSAHWDQVGVRPGHGNLYANWRVPDVYRDQGPGAVMERDALLWNVQEFLWRDVGRTLQEKLVLGRRHDTDTYSGLPSELRLNDSDSSSTETDSEADSDEALGEEEYDSSSSPVESCDGRSFEVESGSEDEDGGVCL